MNAFITAIAVLVLTTAPAVAVARQADQALAAIISKETAPLPLSADDIRTLLGPQDPSCKADTCLATNKDAVLRELANHEVRFHYFEVSAKGELTALTNRLGVEGSQLLIQRDHRTFKRIGSGRSAKDVGFLIRIQLLVRKGGADLDLSVSSLFAIGAKAKTKAVDGELSVFVYGLSGEPILGLLPSPSDISDASIQAALESVALIKSKVYDSKVSVVPQEISN